MKLPHELPLFQQALFFMFSVAAWPLAVLLKEQVRKDRRNGVTALIGLAYQIPICFGLMVAPICFAFVLDTTPLSILVLIVCGLLPGYMFFGGIRKLQAMKEHQESIRVLLAETPLQSLVVPIYCLGVTMDLSTVCLCLITSDYTRGALLTIISVIVSGRWTYMTTDPTSVPAEVEGPQLYAAYKGEAFLSVGLSAMMCMGWSFLVTN